MEKSIIERLEKLKTVVISYDLWTSRKKENIFLLTTHYFTGLERNNTNIGIIYTNATDVVSLSLSVIEVVENFGLEAKIVGTTSDGGGNIWICRE